MNFKSRKFLFGIFVVIMSTIMVYVGNKLSGAQWIDLIKWIGPAYFLSNAVSKFAKNGKTENGNGK